MATGKFFEQFVAATPGFIGHLIFSVIIIAAFGILCKFLKEEDLVTGWLFSDADEGTVKTMGHVLVKSLRMIVMIVGVLTLAGEWGFDLKPVLASLGIVSMALALAAQDMVKNFIGAIVILMEDIFHIGDRITVGGVTGVVETINFRSTQIRTDDGNLVYVPNSSFSSSNVTTSLKTKSKRAEKATEKGTKRVAKKATKKVTKKTTKKAPKRVTKKATEQVTNKEPKTELKTELKNE